MNYESVVLHAGDHGAATVVLPVPRLRTIYTASEARSAGMYRWHPLPLHYFVICPIGGLSGFEARDDGYTIYCLT